jgi:RHS repeat-associated protein
MKMRWASQFFLHAAAASVVLVAAIPGSQAGERCAAHFPELRRFVETAGSRATPDETTSRTLTDELAIERALWIDEVARNRNRLGAVGATVGLARLDAIDADLAALFDQLSSLLAGRMALDEDVVGQLLDCGESTGSPPEWPIRSADGPTGKFEPAHREVVVSDQPPEGYHDAPAGAQRRTTKADPADVWPDDPLHPVVVKAAELGHDPIATYHFVLNEIQSEHYFGSLKDPAVVLRSGSGNDADQALLLTELLRASGYPARLARGVVEYPTGRLESHFAVAGAAALEELLTTMGAAWSPVGGGIEPAAYRVERFWCEVWIPYGNFRGVELDVSGESWAVLDPEFEDRGPLGERRVLDEIAFDAEAFLSDYLTGQFCGADLEEPGACPQPRALVSSVVDQYLGGLGDPESYETLSTPVPAEADELPILPASMPGHIVSVGWTGLEAPIAERHRVHLVARHGGAVLLDAVIPMAELTGREAALWYAPATPDDVLIVRAFDNFLWNVPPYLVNVTPVVIHRGGEIVRGSEGIGMGRVFELETTMLTPVETSTGFSNEEIAGVPTVIGISAGTVDYEPVGADPVSSLELLSTLVDDYLDANHRFASELAVLGGHGLAYGAPTLAFLGNEVVVYGALGLIQTIEWEGLYLDVDSWGPRAVGGEAASRHLWRTLAQLEGSVAERAIFEAFDVTSVSADLALIIADDLGIQVVTVDQDNLASALTSLPYQPSILAEIEAWVLAGGEALVPAQPVDLLEWLGVGYLLIDPSTGDARYQLAGALSGGSTADPPAEALAEFGLELWPPTQFPVNPDPSSVVAVRKLAGFDGAEGIVGDDAEVDIRVEALDRRGARVQGVPVLFSSVAGGGSVIDDQGVAQQELLVPTDEHGTASVGFRFGTDTASNPVYALEEPTDEFASQALLQLVDAVGRSIDGDGNPVDLPVIEPFWAVAFPDTAAILRRTDTANTHFVGFVAQWADTIYLAVEDQYGNPVSNVPVAFEVQPLQLSGACSNYLEEPQRLNAAVFDNLLVNGIPACGGHPVLGSCGGPSLTKMTAYTGTSAGVIEGDVVAAIYTVQTAVDDLPPLSYTYTQNWTIDPETQGCDTPDRFGVFSSFLTDEDGRNVNAATAGLAFTWPIDFRIEFYEPEPRDGDPPFYAGGGQWWAVCGQNLGLAVTNSGEATAPVFDALNNSYRTYVTTGFVPSINELSAHGTSFTYCANGTPLDRPLDAHVNDVWGILPEITGFQPDVVVLTPEETLAEPLTLGYRIEPPEYVARSVEIKVHDLGDGGTSLWPGSSRSGEGSVTLPRGEEVELEHQHMASVVVNREHPAHVDSADEPLPLFQPIFSDVTRFLQVSQELDVVNRTTCADTEVFSFSLNHPALVTLTFVRETPTGPGAAEAFINSLALEAGDHSFTFSPASSTPADFTLLPGRYSFELVGISQVDGHSETENGGAFSHFSMRDSLPVGHAMVKGVDLFDGHLVLSRDDLAVPGRGVPLSFQRTYSSASAEPGHLGRGWTHNWLARVIETPCAELILIGTEGSGMRFTPDGSGGWTPPRGYHGTLLRNDVTDEIDFYTTGGTHYHFLRVTTLGGQPVGEWFLDFVEDPSGNRTNLVYEEGGDGLPRVKRVVEPTGRELLFTYDWRIFEYWGGDVLTRVDGPDFLETRFDYDARGNLIEARREGDIRFESYAYEFIGLRDVLTGVRNELNGAETGYAYSNEILGLVGDAADIFLVERLTEPEGGVTQFFYDTAALAAHSEPLTTWVRDPRESDTTPPAIDNPGPYDTTYTLNRYGSPTTITDPLGHTTTMQWKPDDVVMDWRVDANGVVTTFDYDGHGNLLTESVTVTDVDGVDHDYVVANTYEPPSGFSPPYIKNRVATHTDRNGATSTFGYDGFGRLNDSFITVTAADGTTSLVTTSHAYDPANGDRLTTTDPRGNTTNYGYDSYGNLSSASILVSDHDGNSTTVSTSTQWDILGRPVTKTDPEHFVTRFTHDTLGRLTSTIHPEVEVDEERTWQPVEKMVYDDVANTVTAVDGRDNTTISTFDFQGRLVQVVNPLAGTKVFDYDKAGNKTADSSVFDDVTPQFDTNFIYDETGRLTQRNEPEGRTTTYTYDDVGNVVRESLWDRGDPTFAPRITANGYDQLNRLTRSIRDPDPGGLNAATVMLLDGQANVVRVTDAEGRAILHDFDELNRQIETTEPEWRTGQPKTTRFFYDRNGNLIRELRANQRLEADGTWSDADQERSIVYDELDRPLVATDAEGHERKSVYDKSGNVVEEIDARGNRTTHAYDGLNRRISTTQHLTDPGTGVAWNVATRWIYDAVGNLRHEFWPNENQVTHFYDAANRLLSSTDLVGPVASFEYDARGNRVKETDGNGHFQTNNFDGLDRNYLTVLRLNRHVHTRWDVAGNRNNQMNPRGFATDFHYDVFDRLVLVEYPELDGGVRYTNSSTYDLVGNQTSATDRNDNTTTFVYDDLNRVVEVLDPPIAGPPAAQYRVSTTHDALGNRVAETDRRGIVSRWVHDRENRPTEAFRDGVRIATTQYDVSGNPEYLTDANGNTTHTVFDERDLETRIERPELSVTRLTRNAMGDVVSELDAENKETTRGFDLRRRLGSETNGEDESTTFTYDFAGNLTMIERPKGPGWTLTRVYDEADRLVSIVDPLNHPTRYEYDPQDNLERRWDANNHVTHFEYDRLDRLIETRYHDSRSWTSTLDGNGNRVMVTDPKDQTVTTIYDELNREVLRTYSAPVHPVGDVLQTIGFSWDENSNLIDATETYAGGSRVTHHEWDSFDRLEAVTDGFGKVLDYGYDLNGNRTSLIDPEGGATVYNYDGLNRIDTVTLPGDAGVADYDWYNNSLLRRVAYPNGTHATYAFDDANRVTSINNRGPGDLLLSSYAYDYDANGNRAFQHETNGGALETTTYNYDLNDRMWQVVYPDQTTTYSFDAVGNRKSEQSVDPGGTTLVDRGYNYDDRNQLYEITDHLDANRSVAYAHDFNGNQTQRIQNGAVLDFRYDARDQLVEVDVDGSNAWTFGFDFRGLRVTKWGADGLLRYTYDDSSVLQQHSALGDPVATYRYGPDRLLAVDHFSQGPAYYHFDALGSIANLTDPSGNVQNRYQYDAWGNHRTQSGTQWNPFGFTGHEYDEETGLYYAKARFYDPEVGRFLSEDPAEPDLTTPPSLHKYLYAYGNPTRYWDPLGLQPEEPDEDASWAAKAWAWVKGFAGGDDLKDFGASGQEALRAFDEQVYGRRGTGSSPEEEIARREEHRQGVVETTGIVLESTKEAGTKLGTAAVKAADAAAITGVVKKGGLKLVKDAFEAAEGRIERRLVEESGEKALRGTLKTGAKQTDNAIVTAERKAQNLITHRAGNRQILVDGQRWHLPKGHDVGAVPLLDPVGDRLQEAAQRTVLKWSPSRLSVAERSAIAEAKAKDQPWQALRLERQARGRWVERQLKRNYPDLEWSGKGVDAIDPATGIAYEVLSGTKTNLDHHAKRMADIVYRMISF